MDSSKLVLSGISKTFGNQRILRNVNFTLYSGHSYCLMGTSGSGKTTLLRILLGLEMPDSGSVSMINNGHASPSLVAVFQENRLCDSFSALENISMVAGNSMDQTDIYREICRLLPEESILRPVSTLSGGMKRRVAILRALLAPSWGILMDEPFTGLDEDTKLMVIHYVKEKAAGKLLLVTTHLEDEMIALGGSLITLDQ